MEQIFLFPPASMTNLLKKQARRRKGDQTTNLAPLNIIRIETVLSKLPIHNLAKKGTVDIHITRKNGHGEIDLEWQVLPNRVHGEPRQLAYKLDTLVINRRFDEIGRPLPKIVRLGSLRDIAKELKLGSDTNKVRKALRQNAFTGISAKLTYKTKDGEKKRIEADFTRYTVVFTGETLLDGTIADAVYLILNDPYWDVLNSAKVRPLDYDYLGNLPPAAQRFYELMSFRIYMAINHHRPYAKIRYSVYCMLAAQQRCYEYDLFKKQMHNAHKPHRASGYIAKVKYEATTDSEGKPDWMMYYAPGPKAQAEYDTFNPKDPPEEDVWDENGADAEPPQPQLSADRLTTQAAKLIRYFYQRFHDSTPTELSTRELNQAKELIRIYGVKRAQYIVDFSYRVAPETDYRPQVFGGILHLVTRALADYNEAQIRLRTQEAIKTCTLCSIDGYISYEQPDGYSISSQCPHDLKQIKAYAQKKGWLWKGGNEHG
jgi:hypothetical protein